MFFMSRSTSTPPDEHAPDLIAMIALINDEILKLHLDRYVTRCLGLLDTLRVSLDRIHFRLQRVLQHLAIVLRNRNRAGYDRGRAAQRYDLVREHGRMTKLVGDLRFEECA